MCMQQWSSFMCITAERWCRRHAKCRENATTKHEEDVWGTTQTNQTTTSCKFSIGLVNNIRTMQFFTGISRNTQSKSYMQ